MNMLNYFKPNRGTKYKILLFTIECVKFKL